MANQHFVIDMTKPHGLKLAKLVRDCAKIMDDAANLKAIADEVTGGGVTLDSADFLTLFGLPSGAAGESAYHLLQSVMAGILTKSTFVEYDQGI